MTFNREYQLDNDSRKEYIEDKIMPYIPKPFREHYHERIPAVVNMYVGSDAEVISIIEDAIRKDSGTGQCSNLEKILGILLGNSSKKKNSALRECYRLLNVNHSSPARVPDVPSSPKKRQAIRKNILYNIDQILANCA